MQQSYEIIKNNRLKKYSYNLSENLRIVERKKGRFLSKMLTEFAGNLAHHLEFGHTLEIVAKTIDGASRYV